MEIRINIDLEAAIASALTPEKLRPILDKHITGAITSAIQDATGYRSAFSEALKEQLAAALPHGLAVDDVVKFQHVLNNSLASLVQGLNTDAVTLALDRAVREAVPDVPASITLTDFLAQARAGLNKEEHEAFYALWEPSDNGRGGHLYLNGEMLEDTTSSYRSRSKYDASYRLAVGGDGVVYALHFRGAAVTPTSRPVVITRFDALLMGMYVGRTRLEVDIDADEVRYAASEKYD